MQFKSEAIIAILYDLLTQVPSPSSAAGARVPADSLQTKLIRDASIKAAGLSAGLSLPPGPVGLVTIIPDLLGIWKLQRKLVVDVAAAADTEAVVTREQMLYCLFRHSASQVVKDILIKTGTRIAVEKAVAQTFEHLLERCGIHLAREAAARIFRRGIPVLGSICSGAYAFYDTQQVGKTARVLMEHTRTSPNE
jgi:hypothetical protein